MEGFFQFWADQGPGGIVRIFWFYFIFEFPRYLLLDYLTMIAHKLKGRFNKRSYDEAREELWRQHPLVSIIVPGKDEGKNYYKLVTSLAEQTYRNYELIMIDDGSEDDTEIIARSLEKQGKIDLFIKNNVRGGKASAANVGVRYAKGEYILHLDADTSFNRDAIEQVLIKFYEEDNIGAVGGSLEVRNTNESLATRFQTIEYLLTFTVGRMVVSSLGILRLISGAFGVFRADVLKDIGGWDVGPGLDGDITLKIRKMGYKVTFAPLAVCLTSVPASFTKLAKQRLRWNRSMIRFRFRKHSDLLFPKKNFSFSNFFAVFDNIFFNFILNFLWWFYIVDILFNFTAQVGYVLFGGMILYTVSKYVEFALVPLISVNQTDKISLLAYIPGMTIYNGIYLRTVRSYAYIKELFFYDSYKDAWNPEKTSKAAREVEDKINSLINKSPG